MSSPSEVYRQREGIMIIRHQMLAAALTCASIVVTVTGAVADSATGIQSPEEIGRQLKSRGLPITGTVPVQSNPAASPVNTPSVPPVSGSRESSSRPSQPAASHPPPAPAAPASITLPAITFEFGSAQLKPEAIEQLRNLGIALNRELKDETKLLIEGHTDRKGTRDYNDELSKRRADAVKDYLVKEMGVSPDRLETVGRGFSNPTNTRNPYAAENRRVVIVNFGAS
jgi:outer membrane protein OmpA-like peptidoglycan-associated protein